MEETKAGRALDALVAEKVMGLKPPFDTRSVRRDVLTGMPTYVDRLGPPPYSTSIEAAWEVVEWMAAQKRDDFGWFDLRFSNDCYQATFFTGAYYEATDHIQGKSAPHAICLAALKAVGAV